MVHPTFPPPQPLTGRRGRRGPERGGPQPTSVDLYRYSSKYSSCNHWLSFHWSSSYWSVNRISDPVLPLRRSSSPTHLVKCARRPFVPTTPLVWPPSVFPPESVYGALSRDSGPQLGSPAPRPTHWVTGSSGSRRTQNRHFRGSVVWSWSAHHSGWDPGETVQTTRRWSPTSVGSSVRDLHLGSGDLPTFHPLSPQCPGSKEDQQPTQFWRWGGGFFRRRQLPNPSRRLLSLYPGS